jgi:hypothetical protein
MDLLFAYILPAHILTTLMMTGIIWCVQLIQYPLFTAIPQSGWVEYERRYTARAGALFAPLMLVELTTGLAIVLAPHRTATADLDRGLFLLQMGLLGAIWLSTFALQVPAHRRLSRGWHVATWRFLVRSNWIRTLLWSARVPLLVLSAWGG